MPVAHGDEYRWRSSIADRVEDETHRTTEPTGEKRWGDSDFRAAEQAEFPHFKKGRDRGEAVTPLEQAGVYRVVSTLISPAEIFFARSSTADFTSSGTC